MHPGFRRAFNAAFTDDLYRRQAEALAARAGAAAGFRLAETPVFLTEDLERQLVATAEEIVVELSEPGRAAAMKAHIPTEWDAPGMEALPEVAQVDLAVVEEPSGRLVPRLIELQGFPSLSAFEVLQSDVWSECLRGIPGLPSGPWSPYFSGLPRAGFLDLFRRTIVGRHAPESVVLVDLHPGKQKTYVDFAATKKLLDVDAVDPRDLVKDGRTLFRVKGGRKVPVERIYNRVVFDELIKGNVALPFDYRDPLDVTWVPHPNWYWTWSKASIPLLSHPAVPKATTLADLAEIPADLAERYVLKPLFSFAGGGVNVEPTRADVERIPASERASWCLQEKISYAPCLTAGDGGGVKVEIRMMFYRPEGESRLTLGLNLCRLSRGKMLGVDFNKDFTWVGSSVAIRPAA
jgi:hypothetical protein